MTPELASWGPRLAEVALGAVQRLYPFALRAVISRPEEIAPPDVLHPAFHGAFDWHSSVHGHWTLAHLLSRGAAGAIAADARQHLERRIRAETIAGELAFLASRPGFERPYGLVWVLELAVALRAAAADGEVAAAAALAIEPLERLAADRLSAWADSLPAPIRGGQHAQSAFALGLLHDWARRVEDDETTHLVARVARRFHGLDRAPDVSREPSAYDFLSPTLGEASLMARVLRPKEFEPWLERYLCTSGEAAWCSPASSPDRTDGKLAHLDGLNLSRAAMLQRIALALPANAYQARLRALAADHLRAGLTVFEAEELHWAGGHWLATFAVYALTPIEPQGRAE